MYRVLTERNQREALEKTKIDCTPEIVPVSVQIYSSVSHILLHEVNVHAGFFAKS